MPNQIFNFVVDELDFLGDILSKGITKKAIKHQGTTPDAVEPEDMILAIENHIEPHLYDFVSEKKAEMWKKEMVKKLKSLEEGR